MIRLRNMLERGRAHPVLGPILLVVVVLLLALLLLHVAHEGWDGVIEFGALCFGIATFLGLVLLERMRSHLPERLTSVCADRGPPRSRRQRLLGPVAVATGARSLPLRR